MATWHQLQRPVRLGHDTLYSVVTDPPNTMRSVTLFQTRLEAQRLVDGLALHHPTLVRHTYIIPPKRCV